MNHVWAGCVDCMGELVEWLCDVWMGCMGECIAGLYEWLCGCMEELCG